MPESLPIALALVALAVAGWDCARRYMQLAHGRMLSADRSQTFERAITTLDLSQKSIATHLQDQAERIKDMQEQHNTLHDKLFRFDQLADGDSDWKRTCERSIELAQEETQKQAQGLVNLALDIKTMQQQQAMALQGIAKLPKQGFGGPR